MKRGKGVNSIDPSTCYPYDLNRLNGWNDLNRERIAADPGALALARWFELCIARGGADRKT